MNRRFRILVTVALLPFGLGVSAAYANHSGYSNMYNDQDYTDCSEGGETHEAGEHFCRTDNSSLTWGTQSSIVSTGVDHIRTVMEGTFEDTQLSVSRENPPVLSGTMETDIYFIQHNLPSGTLGTTWCNDAVDSERCDQHYIWTDSANPGTKLACHEAGHGVGLTHGTDGHDGTATDGADFLACMQQPASQITDAILGSHNTGEINDVY